MDVFVAVEKLDRRGRVVPFPDFCFVGGGGVAKGWLRVSHRELDPARSTPLQPWLRHEREQKLEVGAPVAVDIEILPSATLFRAGESLRLVISGRDISGHEFGALSAEADPSGTLHEDSVNEGPHLVWSGGDCRSYLLVPFSRPEAGVTLPPPTEGG